MVTRQVHDERKNDKRYKRNVYKYMYFLLDLNTKWKFEMDFPYFFFMLKKYTYN